MNNKIVSTKRTSAIFLAFVLVTGTITSLSFPSFLSGVAQAQSDYDDSGMDNNYKKSYGKDNRDKSKDIKVNINKLKCINTNLNINGNNTGNVNVGNSGQVAPTAGYGEGYNKKDKGFTCIINNNNNNTNVVAGGGNGNQTIPPEPSTTSLSVLKTIKYTPSVASLQPACDAIIAGIGLPAGQITPNEFNIVVTGTNPNPSQFDGSTTAVVVTLGPGPYQVSDIGDPSVAQAVSAVIAQFQGIGSIVGPIPTFSGDCTQTIANSQTATGTIAAGESQTCNIENAFSKSNGLVSPETQTFFLFLY